MAKIISWFENPPRAAYSEVLIDLWLRDTDLGNAVAGLPWVADRVGGEEAWVLHNLRNIADTDQELAKQVASLSWFADGVTNAERDILRDLGHSITSKDAALARRMISLPWFAEGPQRDLHTYVLRSLARITELGAGVLGQLTAQPWFADGLNEAETAFVITLPSIALKRPDLYDDLLSVRYTQHKTISLPLVGDVNISGSLRTLLASRRNTCCLSLKSRPVSLKDSWDCLFPTTEIILLTVPSLATVFQMEDYIMEPT